MRPKPVLLPAAFALSLAAALAFGRPQRDLSDVVVKAEPVRGAVHVLFGAGGNIGVSAGADGVLLIDDQFTELVPKIEAALAGIAKGPPKYLLNTHWHGDHTGANAHFGARATVVAHENVRTRLASGGGRSAPMPAAGLPVVTYAEGLSVHFNGEEIRVLHLPRAHTDGDSVVWFTGSNVVHMGDLYFQAFYPYVDLESGGSVEGVLAACRAVLALVPEDARIIPGHGVVTGVAELRDYVAALADAVAQVRAALAAGKDAATMHAEGLLAEYDPRWAHGDFMTRERFLAILAEDLGAGKGGGPR